MSRSTPAQPRIQLNVGVPPAVKERLALLAARRKCFETELVREALAEFLDRNEKRARP